MYKPTPWKEPLVYIASPYTSSGRMSDNVGKSMRTFDVLARMRIVPISPLHFHFQHIAYPLSDQRWMEIDLALVARCDAVLRLSGESLGADSEVAYAKERGIPVFYDLSDLFKWSEDFIYGRDES